VEFLLQLQRLVPRVCLPPALPLCKKYGENHLKKMLHGKN
jgi:hypothetical protein